MTKDEKKAKNKAFYEQCKKDGRCVNCGNPVEVGQIRCKSCKEKEHNAYIERRNKRKQDGVCVKCGKRPAVIGQTMCEQCKDANTQYRIEQDLFCKSVGICIKCHKVPADKGYIMCLQCRMDERERNKQRERPTENRQAEYAKGKQLRDERKANGQCPMCGRVIKSYDNHVYCEYCRAKARKRERKEREKQGIVSNDMRGNGIYCAVCRKPVEHIGEKMCDRCRTNALKNIEKARENRPTDNLFAQYIKKQWRQSEANAIKYGRKVV